MKRWKSWQNRPKVYIWYLYPFCRHLFGVWWWGIYGEGRNRMNSLNFKQQRRKRRIIDWIHLLQVIFGGGYEYLYYIEYWLLVIAIQWIDISMHSMKEGKKEMIISIVNTATKRKGIANTWMKRMNQWIHESKVTEIKVSRWVALRTMHVVKWPKASKQTKTKQNKTNRTNKQSLNWKYNSICKYSNIKLTEAQAQAQYIHLLNRSILLLWK